LHGRPLAVPNTTGATATLDQLISRAEIIQIVGKSYRLHIKACKPQGENGKENT